MTDAKSVKIFSTLEVRAKDLGLELYVGHENFVVKHNENVICFTDSIEGLQCSIDTFEYCTNKNI